MNHYQKKNARHCGPRAAIQKANVRLSLRARPAIQRQNVRLVLIATLALILLLPTAAFASTPAPSPSLAISGVSTSTERTLTIIPKDALKLTDDKYSDPMWDFKDDTTNTNLTGLASTDTSNGPNEFRITKIIPTAADLSKITPGVGYTMAESSDGTGPSVPRDGGGAYHAAQYYFRTNGGADNRAVISFSSPDSLKAGGGATVKITFGTGYLIDHGGAQSNNFDGFVDTLPDGTKTADGVYLIELVEDYTAPSGVPDQNHMPPWYCVVEIPTLTQSAAGSPGSLTTPTDTVNYNPIIFPKVKEAHQSEFSMYVDIIDVTNNTTAALLNPRATNSTADWHKVGITKGTTHVFTAAFTLNGIPDMISLDTLPASDNNAFSNASVILGMGLFEAPPVDSNGKIPGLTVAKTNSYAPRLQGFTPVTNKIFTAPNGNPSDYGILITDTGDRANTKYVSIKASAGYDAANSWWFSTAVADTLAPGGNTHGEFDGIGGTGQTTGGTPTAGPILPGPFAAFSAPFQAFAPSGDKTAKTYAYTGKVASQVNVFEAVSDAFFKGPTSGGNRGNFASLDLRGLASKYTDIDDADKLFAPDSKVKIELVFSLMGTVTGSAFRANDTTNDSPSVTSEDFTPFLYGATNGRDIASNSVKDGKDFFSWAADNYNNANPATPMPKRVGGLSTVHTGALSAVKVDDGGKPLAGARFALARVNSAGTLQYAGPAGTGNTNTQANFNNTGPAWQAAAPAAAAGTAALSADGINVPTANVYVAVSDADGKVTFDGLAPGRLDDGGAADPPTADSAKAGTGDGNYAIVELATATGYKLLPSSDFLTWIDPANPTAAAVKLSGSGAQIDPIRLNWASQKAITTPTQTEPIMAQIINVPKLALPNTGGPGLIGIVAIGCLLVGGGVAVKRRNNKAAAGA